MTGAQEDTVGRLKKKHGSLIVHGRRPDGDVGVTFIREGAMGKKTIKATISPTGLVVEGK